MKVREKPEMKAPGEAALYPLKVKGLPALRVRETPVNLIGNWNKQNKKKQRKDDEKHDQKDPAEDDKRAHAGSLPAPGTETTNSSLGAAGGCPSCASGKRNAFKSVPPVAAMQSSVIF